MLLKYLHITILICCTILVNGQSADFTFTTANNLFCNPQTVTFTQNCSGTPDAFFWNFGNGQIGNNTIHNIIYNNPGTYTISLNAVYANNVVSISKIVTINATPTISLTADRNYICQPGIVTFTANASNNTTNYLWDFGDGSGTVNTTTNTTTHNFTLFNTYTTTVKAITANGCTADANTIIQVKKMPITATVLPTSGCIPILVTFNANATLPINDVVTNYNWDFGNGNNATTIANTTSTIYNTTNIINTASVLITSLQGCTQTFAFPTLAYGTPPFNTVATTITNRDTFCGSENIAFKCIAANAKEYSWDFGDSTSATTNDTFINHQYTSIGNKQIIVIPIFNGCKGTPDTIHIVIKGVIAKYSFSNTCSAKNTFQFTNNSIGNISKYIWNFNNNLLDSLNFNITHTYPTIGAFNTTLIVYDLITGCSDTLLTKQYTALPILNSSASKICKDSSISYNVLNPYNSASNYSYVFNMAGNNYNNGTNTTVQTNPNIFGNFNDYVVIINPAGNTCNDTVKLNYTTLVAGPNVQFITDTINKCSNLLFPFTNQSFPYINNDSIIKWKWNFGDNTTDSIKQPLPKKYFNSGTFLVSLIATDVNNCKQKYDLTVNAYPAPFIKAFPISDTICQGQNLMITAYTNDTLTWTPITNIACSNCDTTFVQPPITTNYIAIAKNSFGCVNSDTVKIKVIEPLTLNIQPFDTSICPKQFLAFRNNIPAIYTWQPNTFLSSSAIANPTAIIDNSIIYTVIGMDSFGCFSDTTIVKVNTFIPPTINAGNDTILNYNTPFTLQPQLSNNISSILWSPNTNNLNCLTCNNPNGIALFSTKYNVEVTSINGCKAFDTILVQVQCNENNIFIPTVFTPNNDGVNDYFYPLTRGYKIINKFSIFNRWGQKVFEKLNFEPNIMQLGWDGKFKNQNFQETQTLVWYIDATCDLGQRITKKGVVILLK